MAIEIKSFSFLAEHLAFTFALDDPEDFARFLFVGVLSNLITTNLVSFLFITQGSHRKLQPFFQRLFNL